MSRIDQSAYPIVRPMLEAAVYYSASSPKFFERIGRLLDPERMPEPGAKFLLEAARAVHAQTGRGPSSAMIAIQRVRNLHEDGKASSADLNAASDLLDRAEEDPRRPLEDDVARELTPVLKLELAQLAANEAASDYSNRRDFERTQKLIDQMKSVGTTNGSTFATVSAENLLEVAKADETAARLPFGVSELDAILDGGLHAGDLGIVLGGTGDGKSMALAHIAGAAMRRGVNVAYATLEMPPQDIWVRVLANFLGWPIMTTKTALALALRRCREVGEQRVPVLGDFIAAPFSPMTTTFLEIASWVEQEERQRSKRFDLVVVDYCDKLGAKGKVESSYKVGEVVVEAMRKWVDERRGWLWTASQAQRRKDRKKLLGVDDVADSMHKSRSTDLMVSLNVDKESKQITYSVAKSRYGVDGQTVGPLPHDFELARLVPLNESPVSMTDVP